MYTICKCSHGKNYPILTYLDLNENSSPEADALSETVVQVLAVVFGAFVRPGRAVEIDVCGPESGRPSVVVPVHDGVEICAAKSQ